MITFHERHDRHVRRAILSFLEQDPDFRLPAGLIADALDSVGLAVSRDQTVSQLEWLAENRLVTLDKRPDWIVATLTGRGADVARGLIAVEGVERLRPQG